MAFKLPKIQATDRIVNDNGTPSPLFLKFVNDVTGKIETAFGNVEQALEQAGVAINLANTAQATANAAQAAADEEAGKSALVNSYVTGLTLSAAVSTVDATKAKITISAHNRVYADAASTTVAVNGGSADLLSFDSVYHVFYDDPARTGGAVTYSVSTNYLDAAQMGDRHSVGFVTTPTTSAAPPTTGGGTRPPGTGTYSDI
jgi:hypothetical protein